MKNLNGAFKWLYDMGNWVAKMMYLHILWVFFSLLGLVIFGVWPATVALFAITRKWVEEDIDIPILSNFVKVYRSQFLKANMVGLLVFSLGIFLAYDFYLSKEVLQSFFVHIGLIMIMFIYFLIVLYLFPVFVRYDLKFFQFFKQSFLVALAQPLESAGMIFMLIIYYYLFNILPVLAVFLGSSAIAYTLTGLAHRSFIKIEEKRL